MAEKIIPRYLKVIFDIRRNFKAHLDYPREMVAKASLFVANIMPNTGGPKTGWATYCSSISQVSVPLRTGD